jgi:hypothetical protein
MAQLNRDMVLWEHRSGAVGVPLGEPVGETLGRRVEPSREADERAAGDELALLGSGRFRGVFPKGTFVDNVVHVGSNDRVKCLIAGYTVTTVSWAISD